MDPRELSQRYEYQALVRGLTIPSHDAYLPSLANKRYPRPVYNEKIKDTVCSRVEQQLMVFANGGVLDTSSSSVTDLLRDSLMLIQSRIPETVMVVGNELLTNNGLVVVKALASPKEIRECWVELMMRLAIVKKTLLYLVLPVHNSVLTINLFNHPLSDLYNEMLIAANPVGIVASLAMINEYGIGSHIPLSEIGNAQQSTVQVFLRNPQSGAQARFDVDEMMAFTNGRKAFIHAPYTLNICRTDHERIRGCVASDLSQGSSTGFRGVVLHTGSATTCDVPTALNNMEATVRHLIAYATEECPLLLETPCGEGNEVCTTIDDMNNFFMRFTEDERLRLSLCVDSCHIYSGGCLNPADYIRKWLEIGVVPIKLIHFNDSNACCHSHKDSHALVGTGLIGYQRMLDVAILGYDNSIPMVIE